MGLLDDLDLSIELVESKELSPAHVCLIVDMIVEPEHQVAPKTRLNLSHVNVHNILILPPRVCVEELTASFQQNYVSFLIIVLVSAELVSLSIINVEYKVFFIDIPSSFATAQELLRLYDLATFLKELPHHFIKECRVKMTLTSCDFIGCHNPVSNFCKLLFAVSI